MNQKIIITPEGIVSWIPDCPVDPELCFHFKPNGVHHCDHSYNVVCVCNNINAAYHKALSAAKQSAISFEDQKAATEMVRNILRKKETERCSVNVGTKAHPICNVPRIENTIPKPDTLHAFPSDKYRVEVKAKPVQVGFEKWDYEKVAVLIPLHQQEDKVESQEEMNEERIDELWIEYQWGASMPMREYDLMESAFKGAILFLIEKGYSITPKVR